MEKNLKAKGGREEIANSLTHLAGLGLSIVAVIVLIVFASLKGTGWHIVSCSIYGATLILLFLSSVLYHSARSVRGRRIFRIVDHSSVFLLIAGTYTPFLLVNLRGGWGWSLFGVIWGMAITGVILKMFLTGRYPVISTVVYLMMGWLVVIAIKPFMAVLPPGGFVWLVAGGLSYTSGILFFGFDKVPFFHAIWHLFVLGGSICHFFAILFYVVPK